VTARVQAWARHLSPLTVRVLSGGLLLGATVALLAIGLYGIYAIAVVAGGVALWEFRQLSDRWGFRAPGWLLYPLGLYFAFSGTILKALPLDLVLAIALVAGLSVFLVLPGPREGIARWAMGLGGALYIGLPFNYYLLIYRGAHGAPGLAWLLLIVVTVVVSDAVALLIGQRLGRRGFFPAISPKKTVEGAMAGLLCSVPVMLVGGVLLLHLHPLHSALIGLLIGLTAQIGDLVESQMKRLAGVKDSSRVIPGHGGILDRMDSAMFPPIVVFLYTHYLGLL